jgi:NADP-dependent 3-hydroxy acid dehydrogenase YdfG
MSLPAAQPDFAAALDGFRVLVTGAGNGIGRALARQLLGANARVIAWDLQEEALATLAAEAPERVHACAFDITDFSVLEEAFGQGQAWAGEIDAFVHCAGYGPYRPFLDYDRSHWERMIAVNMTAYADVTRLVLPSMVARGAGHIVVIGSERQDKQAPRTTIYAATKAGVAAFSRALALDYGGKGVQVCIVAPGGVKTNFGDIDASAKDARFLSPEMVADAVVFMLRHRNHAWVRDMTVLPLGV